MQLEQVAVQLYTVRERAAADFVATLGEVAGIGYRAVELAGTHGLAATEVRAVMDRLGLRAMGAHLPFERFAADAAATVAEAVALGCEVAVVPSVPAARRGGDAAAVRELAATLNGFGERCRVAGLAFAYHNHDFELAPLADDAGRTMLDVLIAETDPALVGFEVDVFWVAAAGHDPVALLERLTGRVPVVHLKDRAAGPEQADAPVGAGTFAWGPILAAAEAAGAGWYVVEQDHPQDAMADVATSLRNLAGMAQG